MPPIRFGKLLVEPESIAGGVNPIFFGSFRVDGEDMEGYIKVLSANQIVREIAAEILAGIMLIPVPESCLVVCPDGMLPLNGSPPTAPEQAGERGHILFGTPSRGTSYARRFPIPSLEALTSGEMMREYSRATATLMETLKFWLMCDDAIVFDEWIANPDRNQGNILIDDDGNISLIDHERAFEGPQAPFNQLDYRKRINNNLLDWRYLGSSPPLEIQSLVRSIQARQTGTESRRWRTNISAPSDRCPQLLPAEDITALDLFLTNRQPLLESLITGKLPVTVQP